MSSAVISTPLGNLSIETANDEVTAVRFTDAKISAAATPLLLQAAKEMEEFFAGKRQAFGFPVKPEGSSFQQKVWQELQRIPYGQTISYQELANRLGDPKCLRAAASANGKNPLAIVIPCHRVIGSDGSMTGYAGGIERKKALLRLEGADIMNQINLFQ